MIKHEDVSVAATAVIKVLAGNSKALKELGITTAQYSAIMKSKLTLAQKDAALLKLIEERTRKGRETTDKLTQSEHERTQAYQDFTTKAGPDVVIAQTNINNVLAAGLGYLSRYWNLMDQINAANMRTLFPGSAIPSPGGLIGGAGKLLHPPRPGGTVGAGAHVLHVHGNVTLVHQDQHAKELAKLHRRNDRAKS